MNTIEAINNRHSYRGKYKSIPVPREDLTKIMQAGLAAPSGCNKQTTSLIAVDDPVVLEKLHRIINPPVGETAPAMICVLTQRINAYRDKCFAVQDYSAAIENMLLAIIEMGYQSCWYEGWKKSLSVNVHGSIYFQQQSDSFQFVNFSHIPLSFFCKQEQAEYAIIMIFYPND